jgi:hypothetical protein
MVFNQKVFAKKPLPESLCKKTLCQKAFVKKPLQKSLCKKTAMFHVYRVGTTRYTWNMAVLLTEALWLFACLCMLVLLECGGVLAPAS